MEIVLLVIFFIMCLSLLSLFLDFFNFFDKFFNQFTVSKIEFHILNTLSISFGLLLLYNLYNNKFYKIEYSKISGSIDSVYQIGKNEVEEYFIKLEFFPNKFFLFKNSVVNLDFEKNVKHLLKKYTPVKLLLEKDSIRDTKKYNVTFYGIEVNNKFYDYTENHEKYRNESIYYIVPLLLLCIILFIVNYYYYYSKGVILLKKFG